MHTRNVEIDASSLVSNPLGELMPHVWYNRHHPQAPDLLVGRWLDGLQKRTSGGEDVNHAYKVGFVETKKERAEAQEGLIHPLPAIGRTIDLTHPPMGRPSGLRDKRFLVFEYDRHGPEWPIILVTALPMNAPGQGYGRERYGVDCFMSQEAAQRHLNKITRAFFGRYPAAKISGLKSGRKA